MDKKKNTSASVNKLVIIYFGIKKYQVDQKNNFKQKIAEFLEKRNISASEIKFYIKRKSGIRPQVEPNTKNIFLRFDGRNTIIPLK